MSATPAALRHLFAAGGLLPDPCVAGCNSHVVGFLRLLQRRGAAPRQGQVRRDQPGALRLLPRQLQRGPMGAAGRGSPGSAGRLSRGLGG